MADEALKALRFEVLEAQRDQLNAETALKSRDYAHKITGDRRRVYHFPSYIISETIDTCIEVMTHWLDMDASAPITIALNSPGGSVFEGWALFDYINDHVEAGAEINVTAYGKVASMAGVVLQAGKVRSMHRHSYFMAHEVSVFLAGMKSTQTMKDQAAFTEGLQNDIEKVLVSRANPEKITQAQLHNKTMHTDWWLNAEEALDYGFIDAIAR